LKTIRTGQRRSSGGFTLAEFIAAMVVIAIIVAVACPRVIHVMARDRVNGTAQSLAFLKSATTEYIAKNGSLPTRDGTGSSNDAVGTGRFDADLVAGGFSEKLFHCPIGRQTVDPTPLVGRIHVRCVKATVARSVLPPTASSGGDNFNLDRDPATPDFKIGQKIVVAFIPGVSLDDAIELNKALDGDGNVGDGPDVTGRCIYSAAANDETTTVYVYIAHY
jgi:prepilin-type N-terminal cleavage/methylation domain-containing protein